MTRFIDYSSTIAFGASLLLACHGGPPASVDARASDASVASASPMDSDSADAIAPPPTASASAAPATGTEPPDASLPVAPGMFGFAPCSGPSADVYARLHPAITKDVLSEKTESLGPVYSTRRFSVKSGGFESVAHYEDLRCGSIVLSRMVGRSWVSPDGNYVVYEDTEGHNLVHGAASGNIRSATPKPYEIPTSVKWDMAQKKVTVVFARSTKPITVALP